MKKWFAPLMSCLVLGLVSAGCGSDDEKDSESAKTTEQPAQQPAQKSPDTGGGTVAVGMKNTEYVPMDVKVKAGGTIEWTNNDSFPHTVTKESGPGAKFDSGTMDGGGTFKQKFDTPGKIDYVCTIHPRQTGTITVE